MSREKSVAEVAKERGLHRSTVYRWFVELERLHGARVIGRRGRRLFTTDEALELVSPIGSSSRERETRSHREREARRVADLETRIADAEVRADKHAEQISDLSRKFRQLAAQRFARQ